jgi:hypothetical protein
MFLFIENWRIVFFYPFQLRQHFNKNCSVVLMFFFFFFFFFYGATARGGPWPPFQYVSKTLDPLLYLSLRLFPSFSGPQTRHPAISLLVFLCVLLHTAFHTTYFWGLLCPASFLCDQAAVFIGF